MLADEQLCQLILELPVITYRQASNQVDRHEPLDELGGSSKGEDLGKLADKLCLVKGKEADVTLSLGQLTDEISLIINLDLKMLTFLLVGSDHFFPELNICCFAQDRLENQIVLAIGCLGKTKAYINSKDFHMFLHAEGSPRLFS